MTSGPLENLARIGSLKAEPFSHSDFEGLLQSGMRRLLDARNTALSLDSRFDLAYNASHALGLAALRFHGYRGWFVAGSHARRTERIGVRKSRRFA